MPLFNFLKQGITPGKLALAVSLGAVTATFPVFGSHSLLCLLFVFIFRLNAAAVFLVNNFAYPLIFITYLPTIRLGEWVFSAPPLHFSIGEIFALFEDDVLQAIRILWDATMHAIAAWFLIAIPLTAGLFQILKHLFGKITRRPGFTASEVN